MLRLLISTFSMASTLGLEQGVAGTPPFPCRKLKAEKGDLRHHAGAIRHPSREAEEMICEASVPRLVPGRQSSRSLCCWQIQPEPQANDVTGPQSHSIVLLMRGKGGGSP